MSGSVSGTDATGSTVPVAAPDARVLGLVTKAATGQLVIYAGAGISFSSHLPSGRQLSERLYDYFTAQGLDLGDAARENLLEVSDTVEALGAIIALQGVANASFDFDTAPPSEAHRAFALMLLDGAVKVLTTNWDTCIERAGAPERIDSIVTSTDRAQITTEALLKVHGCTRRQDTLLLTTAQLAEPPVWADSEIAAGLAQATVVFVGIGDVAPYVRKRLDGLLQELGSTDHVVVVGPHIAGEWNGSGWSQVLPDLPDDQKWEFGATEFSEDLLRAWIIDALVRIAQLASDTAPALATAFSRLNQVLVQAAMPSLLAWIRRCHYRPRAGHNLSHHSATAEALLGLSLLCEADAVTGVPLIGPARLTSGAYADVLAAAELTPGHKLADEASRRVREYGQSGQLGPNDKITIVCTGVVGALPGDATSGLPIDVVDDGAQGILGGANITLVRASDILKDVAA